ncbi:hypothetical protein HDU93_006096 [Gonapodya sp. JEL0774]|nr:hypothetical protein HDU93_006096 [Gonapodya sp. JEL0774]
MQRFLEMCSQRGETARVLEDPPPALLSTLVTKGDGVAEKESAAVTGPKPLHEYEIEEGDVELILEQLDLAKSGELITNVRSDMGMFFAEEDPPKQRFQRSLGISCGTIKGFLNEYGEKLRARGPASG